MNSLRVGFDRRVRLEFHGTKVGSEAGLFPVRELDRVLGLTELAAALLQDNRTGTNIQHSTAALLRQYVYSRVAGYEDTNDAQRLALDPVMRMVVAKDNADRPAASSSALHRFETKMLTSEHNLAALDTINRRWVAKAMSHTATDRIVLDMDSSESPAYGNQEKACYNGYFESVCYHPLFCFNQYGDCEGAMLRAGDVSSGADWRQLLMPIVNRYRDSGLSKYFRGDAGFAKPQLYRYLEKEGFRYAIRLPANQVLQQKIAALVDRPAYNYDRTIVRYYQLRYQAGSWRRSRRVVAQLKWHPGKLFAEVSFIVTNMSRSPQAVVEFYNKRGKAEQWIKEGKYALNWTRLSAHRFPANQVRLALFVLAYNLGNFLRRLALPASIRHWSLRSIQTKLIKIGARVVFHARRIIFQLAEVAVPKQLFSQILQRIWALAPG